MLLLCRSSPAFVATVLMLRDIRGVVILDYTHKGSTVFPCVLLLKLNSTRMSQTCFEAHPLSHLLPGSQPTISYFTVTVLKSKSSTASLLCRKFSRSEWKMPPQCRDMAFLEGRVQTRWHPGKEIKSIFQNHTSSGSEPNQKLWVKEVKPDWCCVLTSPTSNICSTNSSTCVWCQDQTLLTHSRRELTLWDSSEPNMYVFSPFV